MAHFATGESLLFLLCTWALWRFSCVAERGWWRDYALAGLATGLACSTKYTPWVLALPFLVAHFAGQRRGPRDLGHRNRTDGADAGVHHRRLHRRVAVRRALVAVVPRGARHHVAHRAPPAARSPRRALVDSLPRHRGQCARVAACLRSRWPACALGCWRLARRPHDPQDPVPVRRPLDMDRRLLRFLRHHDTSRAAVHHADRAFARAPRRRSLACRAIRSASRPACRAAAIALTAFVGLYSTAYAARDRTHVRRRYTVHGGEVAAGPLAALRHVRRLLLDRVRTFRMSTGRRCPCAFVPFVRRSEYQRRRLLERDVSVPRQPCQRRHRRRRLLLSALLDTRTGRRDGPSAFRCTACC